uniref:Uncharacterized protein n=1 Tax=Arundo donax TaxID=35708 RepID=A0A0A9FF41_ARUDO
MAVGINGCSLKTSKRSRTSLNISCIYFHSSFKYCIIIFSEETHHNSALLCRNIKQETCVYTKVCSFTLINEEFCA